MAALKDHLKGLWTEVDKAIETGANAVYIATFGVAPPEGSVDWKGKAKFGLGIAKKVAKEAANVLVSDWIDGGKDEPK